ncbi:MAG: hypothetical protein HQL54_12285 [Magnetococcales bacterium]|nr:hypothetical protein [Magnetococcales bacterium]
MHLASLHDMKSDMYSYDVNPFFGLLSITAGPIIALVGVLLVIHYMVA